MKPAEQPWPPHSQESRRRAQTHRGGTRHDQTLRSIVVSLHLGMRIATADLPLDRIVETPVLGVPQNLPFVARPQRVDRSECP
jgi:hypothetical protein